MTHDAVTVVPMAGDIDLNTSADVAATIRQAVDPGPMVLVIDMTEVSFLSATGLSVLVAARRRPAGRVSS
ncbi:hypothetical protein GCM10029964_054080 [Kibdelosporangium lantanae]